MLPLLTDVYLLRAGIAGMSSRPDLYVFLQRKKGETWDLAKVGQSCDYRGQREWEGSVHKLRNAQVCPQLLEARK